MKKKAKTTFVVIGSSGGGGTIAWVLAKAGYQVTVLEAGKDLADIEFAHPPRQDDPEGFNSAPHDEYRYRLQRPDIKRRRSGDYNTFRRHKDETARPTKNGWTGTTLGGGSLIWGTWAFRALPVDYKLRSTFDALGGTAQLDQWGYTVADWPIKYTEMEPFYNAAEVLLAVSGDRGQWQTGVEASKWYQMLGTNPLFAGQPWWPRMDFPCPAYPITPVGYVVQRGMAEKGMHPLPLPSAIVHPGSMGYSTRDKLASVIGELGAGSAFWSRTPEELWSDRVRLACKLCGFCGEYLCFGGARATMEGGQIPGAAKSGAHATVLKELQDMPNASIVCDARAFEIVYAKKHRRATGVRWLDLSNEATPKQKLIEADYVIVSCGAVQSARLLWMSGGNRGLGNEHDQLGRNATWHMFGLSSKATFDPAKFDQPLQLRGELGHTGNVTSFEHYLVANTSPDTADVIPWLKAGTLVSTAKKNPLENAADKAETIAIRDLHKEIRNYSQTVEVRLTADDLPMKSNRVDLDPTYVDEYGFPVARITRQVGPHEWLMYEAMKPRLLDVLAPYKDKKLLAGDPSVSPHVFDLVGDHQMGTCRMGEDPAKSVIDPMCRLHEAKNCFVVDSSFMPTGLGLNPMVTVVANALRIGTYIVDTLGKGGDPAR